LILNEGEKSDEKEEKIVFDKSEEKEEIIV